MQGTHTQMNIPGNQTMIVLMTVTIGNLIIPPLQLALSSPHHSIIHNLSTHSHSMPLLSQTLDRSLPPLSLNNTSPPHSMALIHTSLPLSLNLSSLPTPFRVDQVRRKVPQVACRNAYLFVRNQTQLLSPPMRSIKQA